MVACDLLPCIKGLNLHMCDPDHKCGRINMPLLSSAIPLKQWRQWISPDHYSILTCAEETVICNESEMGWH